MWTSGPGPANPSTTRVEAAPHAQQAIDPAGPRHQGLSPRITEKTFNLAGPVATQRVNRSKLRSRAPPLLHPWPRPSFESSALAATPPVGLRSVLVVVPRAGFNFSLNTFSHLEQHRQIRHRSAIIPTIHSFLPGPGCSIITPLSTSTIPTLTSRLSNTNTTHRFLFLYQTAPFQIHNLSSRRERLSCYTHITSQPHFERTHWRESLLLAGRNIAPSLLVKGTSQAPGRNVKSTQPLTGLSINSNAKDIRSLRTFFAVFLSVQAKSAPAQLIRTDHRLG